MKLLLDENVAASTTVLCRQLGHDRSGKEIVGVTILATSKPHPSTVA